MVAGTNFITDVRNVTVDLANNTRRLEKWYLFRIPVKDFESKDDSVVMRFGKLELVRNQWRKFQYRIDTAGQYVNLPTPDPIEFNTLAVNLEENDQRQPVRYVSPPGIERQQQLSNNNVQLFLNEQSLSVQACGLQKGETRGVFKTMNLDMRQYGKLRMFIHAEGRNSNDAIKDYSLTAIIRIGNDFQGNYYERVGIQYTEDYGTTLPGYMDSTHILGSNPLSGNPGFDFIFGYQPDTSWINRFGTKGLFSHDPRVSAMIQQRFNQRLNITAQLSPVRDLNVDVNFDKTFDKQYSELYKDTTGTSGLSRLNPYAMGSFSISYISYQTLFRKFDPNVVSETFKEFEANRILLSQRLGTKNPYQGGGVGTDGFYEGYGKYAQDVVIPSFLAAYTGKDPMKVKLFKNSNSKLNSNPFASLIPKPNWTITYNGLSKIPGLDKIFANVTLRHGYHSTLGMNSFNTALLFQDPFRAGYPFFKDTLTDMAKEDFGLTNGNDLKDIYLKLTDNIHPLSLGNVYKSKAQIKMLAEKLLKYHTIDKDNVPKVISFLCSESGSHDYTIYRKEAKEELGLNVEKPNEELYG
ncbi:hypothetical protein OSTOST_14119, partial [Ostertagia ostertagi]